MTGGTVDRVALDGEARPLGRFLLQAGEVLYQHLINCAVSSDMSARQLGSFCFKLGRFCTNI